jgi:hypothetical protein
MPPKKTSATGAAAL